MKDSRGEVLRRRAVTVPGVVLAAWLLAALFLPLAAVLVTVDVLRGKVRLPLARLVSFGLCWAWLETIGVVAAAGLWLTGRARDVEAHSRLQRWWAARPMASLRVTCGITIHVEGVDELHPRRSSCWCVTPAWPTRCSPRGS